MSILSGGGLSLLGSGLGALGSIAGGILGSGGADDAAKALADAYAKAAGVIQDFYGKANTNLSPYMTLGTGAVNALENLTGTGAGGNPLTAALTAKFNPTIAQLEQTPGYQFTLNQGLKGVQNSLGARGLSGSGEALAGAANYATGLAGTTFQQQFQNYLNQNAQIFNMLSGQAGMGQTAATNLSGMGMNAASAIANTLIGGGNAQALGDLGSANAWSGAINGVTGLLNNGLGGNITGGFANGLLSLLSPSSYGGTNSPSIYNAPVAYPANLGSDYYQKSY